MSAGFYIRSILTVLAGALIVLGVAYEERLIAFEQNIAARWRRAWEKNFGGNRYGVSLRPKGVQPRAVSYRTRISSQIEVVHAAKPEFAPERRDEIAPQTPSVAAKSA
ncbi:MAG: hypothetical protein LBJ12_01930 [Oscillospiraceae bacterium]|jgi:hypothetical protein|nr:hypothetical protein [Oscillospiraceae bacterium]